MSKWTWTIVLAAMLAAGGCQTKPPSKWVPVPLPLELTPSTKLTVVGTGETAEAAREAAINQMVHQVILPPSEPEHAVTAEFVGSMIRGYNVSGVAKDFLGKYYVTVELSISQLGLNYQELYHACRTHEKEIAALKTDTEAEEQRRLVAEERIRQLTQTLENDRKSYEDRMLALKAASELNEQRVKELSQQRLADEKANSELQQRVGQLEKERDALEEQLAALRRQMNDLNK